MTYSLDPITQSKRLDNPNLTEKAATFASPVTSLHPGINVGLSVHRPTSLPGAFSVRRSEQVAVRSG